MRLRRIGLNTIWLLAGRLANSAIGLLFAAFVARHLGPELFGRFAVVAALVLIGNAVTTFGTDTLVIRDVARAGRATGLAAQALWLQALLALGWITVVGAVSLLLPPVRSSLLELAVYSLALLPWAWITVYSSVLRGLERMDLFVAATLVAGLGQLAAVGLAVAYGLSLLQFCALLSLAQLGVAALTWWLNRRAAAGLRFEALPARSALLALARMGLPMVSIVTLALVQQRLGLLALLALDGEAGTSMYAAALKMVDGVKVLHYGAMGALLPAASKLAGTSPWGMALSHRPVPWLAAAGAVLAAALTWVGAPLADLLFGPGFGAAAGPLGVLAWSLVPYSVNAYLSVVMIAAGDERWLAGATAVSLLISLPLYMYAGMSWGAVGAAWAALVGECILAAALLSRASGRPQSHTSIAAHGA